jgi:hypothetical protein
VWTAYGAYDDRAGRTTLFDGTAAWTAGEHIGKTLNPDIAQVRQSLIVDNTADTLTVWGDFAALASAGTRYQIHDYGLSPGSGCIDAASNGLLPADVHDLNSNGNTGELIPVDLDGGPRIAWCTADMGAYEYAGPFGDSNDDCVVDLADFAVFEGCHFGPGLAPPMQECLDWFDFYGDADVDLADFAVLQLRVAGEPCIVDYAVFEGCLAGPGVAPPLAECLDVFDYDADADVDLADFAVFQRGNHAEVCRVSPPDFAVFEGCLIGPDTAPPTQACLDLFDCYSDADVDLVDFAVFQLVFLQ